MLALIDSGHVAPRSTCSAPSRCLQICVLEPPRITITRTSARTLRDEACPDRPQDGGAGARRGGGGHRQPHAATGARVFPLLSLFMTSSIPSRVRLIDVGPATACRTKNPVPAAVKVELVHRLQQAGLKKIRVTSYVSPKWVPQMADNHEVMAA